MNRLFSLIAALAFITIGTIGCNDSNLAGPDAARDPGSDKHQGRTLLTDHQETSTDIFSGFRVVIFWRNVGGTWMWRVEIYRNDDGSYVQGSGWDTYGSTRDGRDGRVRDQFDGNHNGYPDGGEPGGGGIEHQS